jgi:ferredoxin-NADP reductase
MMASGEKREIKLCFGVNEERDLFFVDELSSMVQSLPDLAVRIAIARGTCPANLETGVATDLIGPASLADTDVYLCGPPAMTDLARMLAAERGAPVASIFSERFVPST